MTGTPLASLGVIGLAAMGANLARNAARRGFTVAIRGYSPYGARHSASRMVDLPAPVSPVMAKRPEPASGSEASSISNGAARLARLAPQIARMRVARASACARWKTSRCAAFGGAPKTRSNASLKRSSGSRSANRIVNWFARRPRRL